MNSFASALFSAVALVLSSLSAPAAAAVVLTPCVGAPADDPGIGSGAGMYAEPRIFLEAQSWWPDRMTHGHVGACVPADQAMAGTMVVNWRIDLHNNTGYVSAIEQEIVTDACSACGKDTTFRNTDPRKFTGPASGSAIHWITTSFDLNASNRSGWQQVQARVIVKVADGRMRPSLRFMVDIQHGKRADDYSRHDSSGYGWHSDTGYAYARFGSSASRYTPTLPYAPVSGAYSFFTSHDTTDDRSSDNITGWMVSVDPRLHAEPPSNGLVLGEGGTSCTRHVRGNCDGPMDEEWSLDTTQLSDGLHFVAIFTHQADSSTKENTGVFKFPIVVDNTP